MVVQPLTDTPENTHQAVVYHLRRNKEMTVAELCQVLGVTAMAVRRHLSGLQKDGLVDCRLVRQSRGRPNYHYKLTEKAESMFPSGMGNMAYDLVDAVFETKGHKGVMELLSMRNEFLVKKHMARLEKLPMEERVQAVVDLFSESGFMTEWKRLPDGNYFIFQQHCAVHHLATQYRQLCVLEPKLMESLLGVKVTREKFMLKDDPICGYLIDANGSKLR